MSDAVMLKKSLLKPIEYPHLVRLGTKGDGGYVIPEDQIASCKLLVSLGLSDNFDFDKEFAAKNPAVRVIGVDHTIGSWWFSRRILIYIWKIFMYAVIFNARKKRKYIERLRTYLDYFSFFKAPNVHLKRRVASVSNKLDISLGKILEQSAAHLSLKSENAHEGSDVLTIKSESHFLHDVFLKMDIEGAEYEIAEDIATHHERIRCIAG